MIYKFYNASQVLLFPQRLGCLMLGCLIFCILNAAADDWKDASDLGMAGKYQEAASAYAKLIRQHPSDTSGYLGRGRALWKLRQLDAAIADFNKVIALNPKNADAYNNRALATADQGKREKAVEDYKRAIELKPNNSVFFFNQAVNWTELNQPAKAIASYNKAIALNEKDPTAYSNRGYLLVIQGNHDQGLADFTQAIKLNNKDAEAYFRRAVTYNLKGNTTQSMADYRKAIALAPTNPTYHNKYGAVLEKLGKYDEAVAQYNKAIELAPKVELYRSNRSHALMKKEESQKSAATTNPPSAPSTTSKDTPPPTEPPHATTMKDIVAWDNPAQAIIEKMAPENKEALAKIQQNQTQPPNQESVSESQPLGNKRERIRNASAFESFTKAQGIMETVKNGQGDKYSIKDALVAAERATKEDPLEATYWCLLSEIYSASLNPELTTHFANTLQAFRKLAKVDWETALRLMGTAEMQTTWMNRETPIFPSSIASEVFFQYANTIFHGKSKERFTAALLNIWINEWLVLDFVWFPDLKKYKVVAISCIPCDDTNTSIQMLGDAAELERELRERWCQAIAIGYPAAEKGAAAVADTSGLSAEHFSKRIQDYLASMREAFSPEGNTDNAGFRTAFFKQLDTQPHNLTPVFYTAQDASRLVLLVDAQRPFDIHCDIFEVTSSQAVFQQSTKWSLSEYGLKP